MLAQTGLHGAERLTVCVGSEELKRETVGPVSFGTHPIIYSCVFLFQDLGWKLLSKKKKKKT